MSSPISPAEFARHWNDLEKYPSLKSIADATGLSPAYVKNKAQRLRDKRRTDDKAAPFLIDRSRAQTTLPETLHTFHEGMTREELIERLQGLYYADPERSITRDRFRAETGISDSTWNRYFGTFLEFRRAAGIELSRQQHQVERQVAKHRSVDHYREFNERHSYRERYLRESNSKTKVIVGASDLHDVEIDPFYLRTLIEGCRLIQPDIINLGGDIFDLAEFGKYGVDPREWDVVGRIKFVHDHILAPLRQACPNAQIDFVEGNHEFRLLRHLADATPALRAVLSDLLGLTVPKLLGLDTYEVNYISKADLAAFTKADVNREIGKSYVIYDDALLVHHHPHAASWGLPGWNGHHHTWKVSAHKSALRGAYQWLQLGCGHQLKASYTEGEFWSLGFNICHLNTATKSVNHEYVNITDMACVGGVYFYRRPDEMVGFYAGKKAA